MKQKKPLNLNPFVLLSVVLVLAWLATFLITPGTLVDGVYTALPKNGFTFNNVFNLFRAIPYGIKDTANLVILVLVIGGALEIYKATGAIDSGVTAMVKKFGSGSRTTLLVILMALFSLIGGWLGWNRDPDPLRSPGGGRGVALGYDGIVACSLLIVGLMAASSPVPPTSTPWACATASSSPWAYWKATTCSWAWASAPWCGWSSPSSASSMSCATPTR